MITEHEIKQDLISLRSGILGGDLPGLVRDDIVCQEAVDLFLQELGVSCPKVIINDNYEDYAELSKAIPAIN